MKVTKQPYTIALLALLAGIGITSRAADIREGLVSYWPLDTISADFTSTPDVVSANNMTVVNVVDNSILTAGKKGQAFQFDGDVSQRYAFYRKPDGVETGLPISRSRNYSISYWVKGKGTAQSDRRMFSESSSLNTDPLFNLGTHNAGTDDTIDVFVRNTGTQINHAHSTKPGLDDNWHHIVWTYDGTGRLYIDGVADYSLAYLPGPTPIDTTSIGAIVRATVGSYFSGAIDEVALWERTLSASEVQTIMNNGIQTPVPAFAATFLAQPSGSTNLIVGGAFTLTAQAIGTRPLTFEWRKNNAVISGQNLPSLSLSNLVVADSGDYTLTVKNSAGTSVSQTAKLVVSVPPPPNLTNDMVAYWPLDEVQGTKTPDVVSGYDMDLQNLTSADLVAGKWGKAFQFINGRQTLLERVNQPSDQLPIYKQPNFTVSLWLKGPFGQQDLRVFSESSLVNNNPLFNLGTPNSLGVSQTALDVFIRNDSGTVANGAHQYTTKDVYDDAWHHIVYIQKDLGNGAMQGDIYIDGAKDALVMSPLRPLTISVTTIGGIRRATRGFWFTGLIDDVAVWKRALFPDEVTKLYTEGTPRPTPIPQPLAIRSFKPSFPGVVKGDSVTLRWDVSKDATQVEIDQGIGDVTSKTVAGAGSTTVQINDSKTFKITVRRGTESLSAQTSVAAVTDVATGWSLVDNLETYSTGPLANTGFWGDLGANASILTVNSNKMIDLRGTGRAAILPLGDLAVKEGQQRTLFFRIYPQGDPTAAVLSLIGLTDRGVRNYADAIDQGGLGPSAIPSNEIGDLLIGARNGVASGRDFIAPVLQTNALYNVWINVRNDPIDVGDNYSIYLQRDGDTQRTPLFENYTSDRDPAGAPAATGGGPTLPTLDKLFVGNNGVNGVFVDDFYISKTNFLATVPRIAGPTTTPIVVTNNGKNIIFVSFHADDATPSAAAATAGFTRAPDIGYTQLLRANGYNVTRYLTRDIPETNILNAADLVIISRSVPSGHYELDPETAAWNSIKAPTMVLGGYIIRQNRLGYMAGTTIPDTAGPIRLSVTEPTHPIFAGVALAGSTMANPFSVLTTFTNAAQRGISVVTGPTAGNGKVLATVGTTNDPAFGGPVIAEWNAGAVLSTAPPDTLGGHRLTFLTGSRERDGLTSEGAGIYDLTDDGTKLFLNAVKYMLLPAPPKLSISKSGNQVVITWTAGKLQQASSITGPWTDVANATSPLTVTPAGVKFYRATQ